MTTLDTQSIDWISPGNFGPRPLANYLLFMLTAVLATVLYIWLYNTAG